MNEQLLQYIWRFGWFNKTSLQTVNGNHLQIIHPGVHNTNQGPDFLNAKIKIGNTIWAGSVELHLKSSDWLKHGHDGDKNYSNVILHVVYKHDTATDDMPVIELHNLIANSLLKRYNNLMASEQFIPCQSMIPDIPEITFTAWKERLIAERLVRKAAVVYDFLQQNNQHWEESFWWLLARSFGTKVNADAFEAVAKSIPLTILAKHKNQLHQLEALLLGQAGLLKAQFTDAYPLLLQKEYKFLQAKYALQPVHLPVYFLRMRPVNFPTVRLAQLAVLVQNSVHLFSKILEEESLDVVKNWFSVQANDFWHYHYKPEEASTYKVKTVGDSMIDNLVINTIAPVLFAYGNDHSNPKIKDKALKWLEETKAEKNLITKGFEAIGLKSKSAIDSQALIELKTQYCTQKRCLQCAVGNKLLG